MVNGKASLLLVKLANLIASNSLLLLMENVEIRESLNPQLNHQSHNHPNAKNMRSIPKGEDVLRLAQIQAGKNAETYL